MGDIGSRLYKNLAFVSKCPPLARKRPGLQSIQIMTQLQTTPEQAGSTGPDPLLTVSQLTHAIKIQLEGQFPNVRLQGEISNFKKQASGHCYFSLKDSQAQVSAVMFRGAASQLQRLPKDGDDVIVNGEISVYAPRGNYQLIIRDLAFAGIGELLLRLEQLKVEINRRGWFRQEHKKALPKSPRRIGIVTSPTGAAIRDMLNVLTRRHAGLHIILSPVKVQGPGSAEEIAQAIREFNQHGLVDAMIIGRGGGSIEDLWAFNEEIVADAIFHSEIPIISAVGHETDHCISDYVADLRAPTPSAAAELLTHEKAQLLDALAVMQRRIKQTIQHRVKEARATLTGIERHPLLLTPYALLGPHMQRLDELRGAIDQQVRGKLSEHKLKLEGMRRQAEALQPTSRIVHMRQKLRHLEQGIDRIWPAQNQLRRQKLEALVAQMQAIDPKNLLQKGYAFIFSEKNQSVITSATSLQVNDPIRILFADGEAAATIQETKVHE